MKTSYTYNENNNPVEITDPEGNTTSNEWDENSNLTKETDPLGNSTTYTFDENGNQTSVTDPLGNTSQTIYDQNNNPTSETDAKGNETTYTYDENGNQLSETDPLGNATTYTFDSKGNQLTETSPLGYTTTSSYDESGNQVAQTDTLGNTSTSIYDKAGNVTAETDENGNKLVYSYVTRDEGQGTGQSILAKISSQPNEEAILPIYIQINYNSAGKIASISDCAQRTVSYSYDSQDNLISKTDPEGNITRFTYNSDHDLTSIADANGNTTTFGYDEQGKATSINMPEGEEKNISYDQGNNQAIVSDQNGAKTEYSYNEEGNPTSVTDSLGNTNIYTYQNDELISETDPLGNTYCYEYDSKGNQLKEIDPLNGVYETVYNQNNDPIKETDENGHSYLYEYDQNSNPTRETDPLDQVSTYSCDNKGNIVSITDPSEVSGVLSYDQMGSVTSELRGTSVSTYSYDRAGNLISLTDIYGKPTTYDYNKERNLTTITDPVSGSYSFSYDGNGNLSGLTEPNGAKTIIDYNGQNLPIRISNPSLGLVTYSYDPKGTVTENLNDKITTYRYDPEDQLTSVTDPLENKTVYQYDPNGNKTLEASSCQTIAFSYDALSRQIQKVDSCGTTNYSYDKVGNIVSQTGPDGSTVTFTYDAKDRLSQVTYPDRTISYTYDPMDRIIFQTDSQTGTTTFSYDPITGQLISTTLPDGTQQKIDYSASGNIASEYQDGITVSYGYDSSDRISSSNSPAGVTHYSYDKAGNITKKTLPNGLSINTTYDLAKRVTEIKLTNEENITLYFSKMTYNEDGYLTSLEEPKGVTSYTYDKIGRLISVTDPTSKRTEYTFDKASNITSRKVTVNYRGPQDNGKKLGINEIINAVIYKLDYKGNKNGIRRDIIEILENELWGVPMEHGQMDGLRKTVLQVIDGATFEKTFTYSGSKLLSSFDPITDLATAYSYDKKGNIISNDQFQFSYDSQNHLIQAKNSYTTINYLYDGKGRRISRTKDGTSILYSYDFKDRLTSLKDSQGNTLARFIWDSNGLNSLIYDNQPYFYHTNHHGDITHISDTSGHIVASYSYDEWGSPQKMIGDSKILNINPFLYVGAYGVTYDKDTGLYHMGAREYDPAIMRFTSPEPEPEKSGETLNPYVYCKNNPVNYVDPGGKQFWKHGYVLGCRFSFTELTYKGYRIYNVKIRGYKRRQFCTQNPYFIKYRRRIRKLKFAVTIAATVGWAETVEHGLSRIEEQLARYPSAEPLKGIVKHYRLARKTFKRGKTWERRKKHTVGRFHLATV